MSLIVTTHYPNNMRVTYYALEFYTLAGGGIQLLSYVLPTYIIIAPQTNVTSSSGKVDSYNLDLMD